MQLDDGVMHPLHAFHHRHDRIFRGLDGRLDLGLENAEGLTQRSDVLRDHVGGTVLPDPAARPLPAAQDMASDQAADQRTRGAGADQLGPGQMHRDDQQPQAAQHRMAGVQAAPCRRRGGMRGRVRSLVHDVLVRAACAMRHGTRWSRRISIRLRATPA